MFARRTVWTARRPGFIWRALSTLEGNKSIYVFFHPQSPNFHILSLLQHDPPNPELAIGITSRIPPTPDSVQENNQFFLILQDVIRENAQDDPQVQAQAQVMASSAGSGLGSGNAFFPQQRHRRKGSSYGGGGDAGGYSARSANKQGDVRSDGRGGWIHISDERHIPDFGRIAEPEDIFGSIEVDGSGQIVGNYQPSGKTMSASNVT
ncbi:MAG: hypothetical protein M1834_008699 [Cirrosporium novae-zelandiae]|nr:MAG: hypothetical protein M1834_008699 [Cirrosporium novae-zelandiae]